MLNNKNTGGVVKHGRNKSATGLGPTINRATSKKSKRRELLPPLGRVLKNENTLKAKKGKKRGKNRVGGKGAIKDRRAAAEANEPGARILRSVLSEVGPWIERLNRDSRPRGGPVQEGKKESMSRIDQESQSGARRPCVNPYLGEN